jgi:hypothetical protein
MPKLSTPLTENQIAELEPKHVRYKLSDGRGLCLLIEPTVIKRWRMGYKFLGTETCMSFGAYPDVSLSAARQQCDNAHRLIADGIDPVKFRRAQAKQNRPATKKKPKLRLSMSDDGGMTIETTSKQLILSPAKVAALRAFLIATEDGTEGE